MIICKVLYLNGAMVWSTLRYKINWRQNSKTIPGTRTFHSFVPVSRDTVEVRPFSRSLTYTLEKATKLDREMEVKTITGYVTYAYNSEWWLAYILDVNSDNSEVRLMFLHPHGPARSYKYSATPDILAVSVSDDLTNVDPKTATGCTCRLINEETDWLRRNFL